MQLISAPFILKYMYRKEDMLWAKKYSCSLDLKIWGKKKFQAANSVKSVATNVFLSINQDRS